MMKRIRDEYKILKEMVLLFQPPIQMWCSMIIDIVIVAFRPFIWIIFSGQIVNKLIINNINDAACLCINMVVLTIICNALHEICNRYERIKCEEIDHKLNTKITDKCYDVGIDVLESYDFQNKYQETKDSVQYCGGINEVVCSFKSIIISLCVILFSVFQIMKVIIINNSLINTLGYCGLLLLYVVSFLIRIFINKKTLKVSSSLFDKLIPYNRMMQYFFHELLDDEVAVKNIHANNIEPLIIHREAETHKHVEKFLSKLNDQTSKLSAIVSLVSSALVGLTYLIMTISTIIERRQPGDIIINVGIINQLVSGFEQLLNENANMNYKCDYLNRIISFLKAYDDCKNKGRIKQDENDNINIEGCNIFFSYPGSNVNVLENVSFKIKSGSKVAIVGENGSGKTTFAKVLCGLYKLKKGEIRINSTPISDVSNYQELFSVVFQDYKIYPISIIDNITLSMHEVDNACVENVLNKTNLYEKVMSLPFKLESLLNIGGYNDGISLSGGELQSLALARALYKDAPVCILDEPSSSLDPVKESEFYSNFLGEVSGKTAIIISHRLSCCKECDQILVFEKGHIVQSGTHNELVRIEGKYKSLWESQAKYYM